MSINTNSLVLAGQLQTAMTAVKTELDKVEANGELNIIEGISIDGASQSIADKTATLNLSAYAKKTDVASGVRVKGTVASFDSLPLNAEIGDMYNVSVAGGTDANGVAIKAGDNVVKTESGWDNFGGLIDLSGKTDKVTSAVSGNVVTFGANGAVVDSGYAIAGDSDISSMIAGIFGASATGGSSATAKPVPTLEIKSAQNPDIGMGCGITYNGDGVLTALVKGSSLASSTHENLQRGFAYFDNTGVFSYIDVSGNARGYSIVGAASYSITLSASETDNYAAKTIVYEHGVEG